MTSTLLAPAAFGADPGPKGAAAPAVPAPAAAAKMDCNKFRDKLTGDIGKLQTQEDQITQLCQHSSASADADQKIETRFGKGVCSSTYKTINYFAKAMLDKADETCRIVDEAKALHLACGDGQAPCLRELAKKDRQAATNLKELQKILGEAKKELALRQDEINKLAKRYYDTIQLIQKKIAKAKTVQELKDSLSCIDTSVFGPDAIAGNGWQSLSPDQLRAELAKYDDAYQQAFACSRPDPNGGTPAPDSASTVTGGNTAPAGGDTGNGNATLGSFTQEIANADRRASEALRTTSITMPAVQEVTQRFEGYATKNAEKAENLGAIIDGSPSTPSTISNTQEAAAGLNTFAGATQKLTAPGGILGHSNATGASSAPGGESAAGAAGYPGDASGGPGGGSSLGRTALGTNGANGRKPDQTAEGGASPEASDTAAANDSSGNDGSSKAAKGDGVNELLGSFGPIGPVAVGGDADLKPPNGGAKGAGKGSAAGFTGAGIIAAARSGQSPDGKAEVGGSDELAAMAGGLPGAPHGSVAEEKTDSHGDPDHTAMLRALLRKRLAERARSGGDTDASVAADAVLYQGHGGRGLASVDEERAGVDPGAESEQAGPQGIDSEPLFVRIHHAHKRFELRHYPRAAKL